MKKNGRKFEVLKDMQSETKAEFKIRKQKLRTNKTELQGKKLVLCRKKTTRITEREEKQLETILQVQ